jgi:hypothetical protein
MFANRVFVMSMFMLLSANDSSILQSTTNIFTTFDFGNTVCSHLVDCKIEESLADNNINIDITKTRSVNVCC